MAAESGRRWVVGACVAASGVLLAWVGGFLLSSGDSRCVDGRAARECSGSFASSTWHGVGLVSVIIGLILVIVAVGFAVHTRRQSHFPSDRATPHVGADPASAAIVCAAAGPICRAPRGSRLQSVRRRARLALAGSLPRQGGAASWQRRRPGASRSPR